MGALADEMEVEFAERGQEAVRIVDLPLRIGGAIPQAIARQLGDEHLRLEEAGGVDALHPHDAAGMRHRQLERVGMVGAHHCHGIARVGPENLVGVTVHALGELACCRGEVDVCAGSRRRRHFVASRRKPSGTGTQLGRCAIS